MSDYIEVHFSGYDTLGTAYYSVDDNRLIEDAFGVTDEDYWDLDAEQMEAINDMVMAYSIELAQDSDLSNGDEVTVRISIDEEKTNKLKSKDEVTFTVTGLEEPAELSDEEIERNVIVNFNGVSGRGRIQIDTTFDGDLYDLWVEAEQDGEIANGDMVRVSLSEESRNNLAYIGYALSGDGAVEFEASGLDVVPETVLEIANLEDVERMISEGINRQYQNSTWNRNSYDFTEGKTYYRQFARDTDDWGSSSDHGSLISLYTINEYDRDEELVDTFTALYGFNNIIIDDNGNTNVTQINQYFDSYDNTYSLVSVEKLMEGYGYVEVE
ncbi:hypothetical protein [Amphibacillus indicireducens]|uniref:Uncharacterized protein n=1 Tax=Amphibacillus indicireducens TaxID=1076330 RepID=A0ABP7VQX1_9BACI